MRVLFLAHAFPRHRGDAAGSFILRLAAALGREGIAVQVVAPAAPGLAAHESFDGVAVERFRYAPRRYEQLAYTGNMAADVGRSWGARVTMVSFLGAEFVVAVGVRRRFQPDLVHAHWWFPGGLIGSWVSALAGIPLVTTLHGTDLRLARGIPAARPAFRSITRKSAAVTTVSRWLATETTRLVPAVRPTVAPMPVDTTLFSPDGVRAREGVLFVGRLTAQKGVEHLIAALPLMRTPRSLDVVGDGPSRAALEQLAAQHGVADRVRWHGALSQQALVERYRSAAVLAVPSIDEGLGLVAVEAQLCCTPVIASASGGLTDVVRDGQTGMLVPPADPSALAAAVDALLERGDRGASLGEAGRLHALATFAPESAARRYADIYRQALADQPA